MTPCDREGNCALFNRKEDRDGWKDGTYVAEVFRRTVVVESWESELRWGTQLWCNHWCDHPDMLGTIYSA